MVEGKDDKKYIRWLLAKTNREKDLSEYRIFFTDTGGSDIPDIRIIDKINRADLPILVLRDRDENLPRVFEKYEIKLSDRIYIWKRREIENYLLSYRSIHKVINERLRMKENASLISIQQVKDKVIQLAQTLIVKTCLFKSIFQV